MSFFVKNAIPGPPSPYTHIEKDGTKRISGSFDGWLVFDQPTSEAWFNPWVKYLRSLGVLFYFGSPIKSFNWKKDKIESAVVEHNGSHKIIEADQYILAISPFGANDVMKISKLPSKSYPKLIQDGPHVQVSFRIGFSEHVSWPGVRRAIILTNSEFNITMYRQDEFWKNVNLGDGNISSLWSGTACISYKPGSLYGRPIQKLTKDEFHSEILHQLSKDKGFNDMLRKANGNKTFSMLPMVHFEIWDSWKFGGEKSIIINDEPKYVDSTNTRPFQPATKTNWSNLWMAGGHVQSSTELWSMESASESGRRAASMIAHTDVINQNRGCVLKLLAYMDSLLYALGLPNIIDTLLFLIIIIIILIIYYVILRIIKKYK